MHGEAARYRLTNGDDHTFDGRWPVEVAATMPYRTRLIVRRPIDPARFNGTLIVSWNNVSNGYDAVVPLTPEVFDGGYAWIGVTAQKAGVDGFPFGEPMGLRSWDVERYGSLSIPDDDLSYDIFTQAAASASGTGVRGGVDPLPGLEVQRLVATGISQSAKRLATYYNAIHPVAGVFDAFFLIVSMGNGTRGELGDARTAVGGDPGGVHVDREPPPLQLAHHPHRSRHAGARAQLGERGGEALPRAPARHRRVPTLGGGRLRAHERRHARRRRGARRARLRCAADQPEHPPVRAPEQLLVGTGARSGAVAHPALDLRRHPSARSAEDRGGRRSSRGRARRVRQRARRDPHALPRGADGVAPRREPRPPPRPQR